MRQRSAVEFTRKVAQLRRGLLLARCLAMDLLVPSCSQWICLYRPSRFKSVFSGATCLRPCFCLPGVEEEMPASSR